MVSAIFQALLGVVLLVFVVSRYLKIPALSLGTRLWAGLEEKFQFVHKWWFTALLVLVSLAMLSQVPDEVEAGRLGVDRRDLTRLKSEADRYKLPIQDYIKALADSQQKNFKDFAEYQKASKLGFQSGQDWENAKKLGAASLGDYQVAMDKMKAKGFSDVDGYLAQLKKEADQAEAEKNAAAAREQEKANSEELAKNLNNAEWLDKKFGTSATVMCGSGTDDYLRAVAKYSFKWDEMGWLSTKFDSYLLKVKEPGVLTLTSNKVSLQNGFGAYARVKLFCDYDTQKKKVLGYDIVS